VVLSDSLQPRIVVTISAGPVDAETFDSTRVFIEGPDGVVGIEQRILEAADNRLIFLPARYLREATEYRLVIDGLLANGRSVQREHVFVTGQFTDRLDAIRAQLDEDGMVQPATIEASTTAPAFWTAHRATLPPGSAPSLPWSAWESGTNAAVLESTYAEAGGAAEELDVIGATGQLEGLVPQGDGKVRIFQRFRILRPEGIAQLSFGSFQTHWYLDDDRALTREAGVPATVWFTRYEPLGEGPFPDVIYGNGYRSHRHHASGLASALAERGLATVSITAVGHGGGPDGFLEVDGAVFSDGGRALDVDDNGFIELEEGMRVNPFSAHGIRGLTDGVRQTVVDYMVAARALAITEGRYFGISNGGRIGALLLSVDPRYTRGVLNVPPSEAYLPLADTWRTLWAFFIEALGLANTPHPEWGGFTEGIPMRGQPVQLGLPYGSGAIQEYLEQVRTAQMPMNSAAYASRFATLNKDVLVQIGRGDPVVTNPSSLDLVREGGLEATTCLVWPERSLWFEQLPDGPQGAVHLFAFMPDVDPAWQPGTIGRLARMQVAEWLWDGTLVDPDEDGDLFGLGDVFEVPLSPESAVILDTTLGYDPAQYAVP
jgi:hypothetical protein